MSLRLTGLKNACLKAIEDLGRERTTIADVGCDHGFLGIDILKEQKSSLVNVIASDLRTGPLSAAAENVRSAGLEERIEMRLCDGLSGYRPGEADIIVISGMGAQQIASILDEGQKVVAKASFLVLSPHSKPEYMRYYGRVRGLRQTDERVICEEPGYYHIMTFSVDDFKAEGKVTEPRVFAYSDTELFGKKPDASELERKKAQIARALDQLKSTGGAGNDARIRELEFLLQKTIEHMEH